MRLGSHIDLPGSRALIVLGVLVALGFVFLLWPSPASEARVDLPDEVDFNDHIRPLLSHNCFVCHGPDVSTREADLRLDTREHATARREEGGRAIVPGSARRSLLIQRITAADPEERMPPREANKTLSPRDIALLKRWIEQGAEYKKHWSLIPPAPPEVPPALDDGQAAIDGFIVAELDARGLRPAPSASRAALIRRLSYVLTGLPPSPEEVRAFVEDLAPDAYATLVDRLLASPHFGERWARHWMDLVRYADSKGHEFDFTIDGTWRYRDYLIRAFNADVPYDEFVTEHLAGDLLEAPRRHPEEGFNESVLGTVFIGMGEGKHSPVDVRIDEAERIDNIIDVTTKTFLGLTVACARCHDHKFDPIPTTDYYALYSIIESTRFAPTALLSAHTETRLDSIKALKSDIRHRLAERWLKGLEETPVRQTTLIPPLKAGLLSSLKTVVRRHQPISPPGQEGIKGWSIENVEKHQNVPIFCNVGNQPPLPPPRSFLRRQEPGGELEPLRGRELNSPAFKGGLVAHARLDAIAPRHWVYDGWQDKMDQGESASFFHGVTRGRLCPCCL